MLLQLRDFIAKAGVVSTQQLTREFQVELSALQAMLDVWVRKGVIRQCQDGGGCKTACFKCRIPPVYYQFCAR
ncbi:MAG: FeoC-like transcriptional regulator [Legionella sp.]